MPEVWERPRCSPAPAHAATDLASVSISDARPPWIFKLVRGTPQKPLAGFPPPPSKSIGGQLLTAWGGTQSLPQLILQPAAPPAALGGLLGPRVGATRGVSLPPAFSLSTNIAFAEGANGNCSHMEAESAARHFAY